jgi:hypothetical protein
MAVQPVRPLSRGEQRGITSQTTTERLSAPLSFVIFRIVPLSADAVHAAVSLPELLFADMMALRFDAGSLPQKLFQLLV